MYTYVSQETAKKFGAWGSNRNWDIDLPTLPMYLLNLTQFLGTGTLPTGVSTPAQVDLEMFLCVLGTSKK